MGIRDRIAKLLALASSPNENEAKAALLKARELMAEHKLRPQECSQSGGDTVKRERLMNISCSKTKYQWAPDLAGIIADHYCCKVFLSRMKGTRTYHIGFIGLDEDFEICKRIFEYAFDCVKSKSDEIFKEGSDFFTPKHRRLLAETYGWGFCAGLLEAFKQQTKQKSQEWGLVMVVPQAVLDVAETIGPQQEFRDAPGVDRYNRDYALLGYEDGKKFDPATRLDA